MLFSTCKPSIKGFGHFLCTQLHLFFHPTTEIRRVSGFNQSFDHERLEHESPLRSLGQPPNGRTMDLEGWPAMQVEVILQLIDMMDVYIVGTFYVQLMLLHSWHKHNLGFEAASFYDIIQLMFNFTFSCMLIPLAFIFSLSIQPSLF